MTACIEWADPRPWPTLDESALHGVAGEIVRAIAPETEADPAALLVSLLIAAGCAIGAGPHARVGGGRHPAREYAVIVGETARARKGQSWADSGRVIARADAEWWREGRESGLSSGEGLVARLADRADGVPVERRVLVVEPEFARVLAVAGREGSTLSTILRDAWDTGDLRVLTRREPLRADGAHVSILAHITLEELRARLTALEIANGLGNRWLFVAARRARKLPSGGHVPDRVLDALAARLRAVIVTARSRGLMRRTGAAECLWASIYCAVPELPGLVGAVTARADAHMLRLSLIYALLDAADAIGVEHVEAAEALWRYCAASAAYIWGGVLGSHVADRLLAELRAVYPRGLDRTEIADLFHRHKTAAEIDTARDQLIGAGLAACGTERTPGRSREVFVAVPRQAMTDDEHDGAGEGHISLTSLLSHPREDDDVLELPVAGGAR